MPSGLKWATCNVGANSPEEYGGYYSYGEYCFIKWGGKWRIPTKEEMGELVNRCIWVWTEQNGKNGYKVTGPNGNSIFLPASGYNFGLSFTRCRDTYLHDVGREGKEGKYWSSSLYKGNADNTCYLGFDSSHHCIYLGNRNYGHSVRLVIE